MLSLHWPWILLLWPLPLLVRRLLRPAAATPTAALRVPFIDRLQRLPTRPGAAIGSPAIRWSLLCWTFFLLATAQPLWRDRAAPLPVTGRDLMLLVDISGSMRQADFEREGAPIDRLSLVKEVAGAFIDHRHGDRLGLILFGQRPYLRAPLTHDHEAVKALLEAAEVALAGEYTAIGDAIGMAVKHMRDLPARSRALVLLTDGDNNSGQLDPRQAAAIAAGYGIRIYTIDIGRQDVPAPNPYGLWSTEGAARFNREVLKKVAAITGGRDFHALDTDALRRVYTRLDELEPALGAPIPLQYWTPLYPWPLAASLVTSALLLLRRSMAGNAGA